MLTGVNVGLGVTGSIAAVRTVELAHELRRRGATVRAIMSDDARGIIHPWALQFATEHPVVTELTGAVEHVELFGEEGWADVLLVAPATANTVGKVAAAIDDTPVTTCATTAIGVGVPVVVAPAMHEPMHDHPGVRENLDRLASMGLSIVPPRIEEGKAKIASNEAICLATARAVGPRPLEGRHLVITSGATSTPIDPVRVLTNRASGRTGRAVAQACYALGADVTLVHDGPPVPYATVQRVGTASEMLERTLEAVASADGLISAAAIGDFTVSPRPEKLPSGDAVTLDLEPGPKLIDAVRDAHPELPIVGFKVESHGDDDRLVEAARETLERVDLAFVVANDASVMGAEGTRVLLVDRDRVRVHAGPKREVGMRIARAVATVLGDGDAEGDDGDGMRSTDGADAGGR